MSRARHRPPDPAPAHPTPAALGRGAGMGTAGQGQPGTGWPDRDEHAADLAAGDLADTEDGPQGSPHPAGAPATGPDMRLDKWLWAARFYKTRSLAADEVGKGRVRVNGQVAKPARGLRAGDQVALRQGPVERTVQVLALSAVRGPAPVAQALYAETAESTARRQQATEARRLAAEPALAITQGRPTKRDRRDLDRTQVGWDRWSASLDPPDG